jgi:hypothetical protein
LKLANQKPLHAGILVLLTAVTAWTLNSIPSWRGWVADPCALATLAFAAILIFFWVNFVLEKYGLKAELRWSAGALCGMPIVYIAKYVVSTRSLSASDGSPRLELLAVALFGSLGWLGLTTFPWILAAGIAAHGIVWDSWHRGNSPYIPNWYAVGCFRIDVAFSAYLALRLANRRRTC